MESIILKKSPQGTDVTVLTPARLLDLYKRSKMVNQFISKLESEIKRRLSEDPNAIPGLKLEEGNSRRSVSDVLQAWKLLNEAGKVTEKQFTSFLSFTFGEAEKAIQENLKLKSKKESQDKLNEILGDVIVKKQNAPSIAIDKEVDVDLIP